MKKFLIEDIHVGVSKGGIACGPIPENVIGEIVLRSDDGKVFYHCLAEVAGTLNFFESEVSIYQEQIDEEFDNPEFANLMENSFIEGYGSYYDFYKEINLAPDFLSIGSFFMSCGHSIFNKSPLLKAFSVLELTSTSPILLQP